MVLHYKFHNMSYYQITRYNNVIGYCSRAAYMETLLLLYQTFDVDSISIDEIESVPIHSFIGLY